MACQSENAQIKGSKTKAPICLEWWSDGVVVVVVVAVVVVGNKMERCEWREQEGKNTKLMMWYTLGVAPLPKTVTITIFAFLSGDPINLHSPLLLQRKLFQSASTFWLVSSQVTLFNQQKHHQACKIFVSSVSRPPPLPHNIQLAR